jgi:autotransporter translocation and assembly factor TamB
MLRFLKILAGSITAVAAAAGLLLLGVQTDVAKNVIATRVQSMLADSTGGLVFKKLSGNLFTEIEIDSLYWIKTDTVLFVPKLKAYYSLASVFSPAFQVDSLVVVHPELSVYYNRLFADEADSSTVTGNGYPNVTIASVRVEKARGFLEKESWFPDGPLTFSHADASAAFSMGGENWSVTLKELSGEIAEPRISESIDVRSGGTVSTAAVTFDRIAAAAGATLVEAAFSLDPNTLKGALTAVAKPLQPQLWHDLNNADVPAVSEASMQLIFTEHAFELGLSLKPKGADSLVFSMKAGIEDTLTVTEMEMRGFNMRGPELAEQSGINSIRTIEARFDGVLIPDAPEKTNGDFAVEMSRIKPERVPAIDRISVKGSVSGQTLKTSARIQAGSQIASASAVVDRLFEEKPAWRANGTFARIKPGFWTGDTLLEGEVNATLALNGIGFDPENPVFSGTAALSKSSVGNLQLESLAGRLTAKGPVFSYTGTVVNDSSQVAFSIGYTTDAETHYDVAVELKKVAVADFLSGFPVQTSLNGKLSLVGSGADVATLALAAAVQIDSSMVAGQLLDRFHSRFIIEDSVAHIHESVLQAGFADASMEGRINLFNLFDLQNNAQLSLVYHNLGPLRELLGISNLESAGTVSASIRQPRPGELAVAARINTDRLEIEGVTAHNIHVETNGVYRDSLRLLSTVRLEKLDAFDIDIRQIEVQSTAFWEQGPVRGRLSVSAIPNRDAKLRLAGDFVHSAEQLSVVLRSFAAEQPGFKLENRGPASIVLSDTSFSIRNVLLSDGKSASITFSAGLTPVVKTLSLDVKQIPLQQLASILKPETRISGMWSAKAEVRSDGTAWAYTAESGVKRFKAFHVAVDSARITLSGTEQSAQMQGFADRLKHRLLSFKGSVPLPGAPAQTRLNMLIETSLPDFSALEEAFIQTGIGALNGALKCRFEASGTAEKPDILGTLRWKQAKTEGVPLDSLLVGIHYQHDKKQILTTGSAWLGAETLAKLNGAFPFELQIPESMVVLPKDSDRIAFEIRTDRFNLAALSPFAEPSGLKNVRGQVTADIRIAGTLGQPEPTGFVTLEKGGLFVSALETPYTDISARAELKEKTVQLSSLSLTGNRGSATASGKISLQGVQPDSLNIVVDAQSLDVAQRKNFKVNGSAKLEISGTVPQPDIKGKITIHDMTYIMEGIGNAAVEDVTVPADSALPEIAAYKAASAEITISIPETFSKLGQRVVIRNKSNPELELRLTGDLSLVKEHSREAQLFGTIAAGSGYARQFTKKFDVNRGNLHFNGPYDDPDLDVETVHSIQRENINIYFRLGGTLKTPQFTYESDPAMDTQDIISYTMFGRPFGTLMGWEQSVAGTSSKVATGEMVADATAAFLIEKAGEIAGEKLGIDVLEIDNSNRTTGGGTTIKAGKYISDRTMLAVIQQLGSSSTTQFTLEHQFRRNLQLIITQSEDNRTGVDILWRKEY